MQRSVFPNSLIFTAENGGPVYGPALQLRQFQRLLERAELPPMVKATSDSYAHVVPELVRDAAARLGDALGGPG